MVARPGQYYANFNVGELAFEIGGRTDIEQYYKGSSEMTNCEPVAQGGFRLSPRSRNISRLRRTLDTITPDSESNNSGEFSAQGVVFLQTFAATQSLAAVAVIGFYSVDVDDPLEGYLQVQYLDTGAVWRPFGEPIRLTRPYRNIMRARPPEDPVDADAIRLRLIQTPAETIDITVGNLIAKKEAATYGPVRNISFTFSDDQAYTISLTRGHADIWREDAYIGAFLINNAIEDPGLIDPEQRFDTLLLFHEDLKPQHVLRDGSDDEWSWTTVVFENVPQVDLGGTYANVVDKWNIYVRYPTDSVYGAASVLAVTIDGEETSGVTMVWDTDANTSWDNVAAGLKTAIESLAGISDGVTVARIGNSTQSATTLRVQFTGDGNEGPHGFAAQIVSHVDRSATVGHVVIGKLGGESIMSATRGYPACSRFYQDRLVCAGFKSRKAALLASVTGVYFDMNVETIADSGAILVGMDTVGAERIQRLDRSKHLVIFTSDAEYYISDRAVTRNIAPTIVECSRNGSAARVPICSTEGELLYVGKKRSMAYAMAFSDLSQSYESEPISLLASHLVQDISDAAFKRPDETTDAGRWYLVREDGVMTVAILIRAQDVSAFTRWQTEGVVKSASVDGMNDPYLAVERTVGGETVRFLERLEKDLILDCAMDIDLGEPGTTVSGLHDYEGASVWAIADGYVVGPFAVEGGEIELPFEATEIQVGRWTPPRVSTLPIPRQLEDRIELQRPIRVHTVRGTLIDTTSLALGANDLPAEGVPLYRSGDATDAPLDAYSGKFVTTGLRGFSESGQVLLTQMRPGSLQVRDLCVEAKL